MEDLDREVPIGPGISVALVTVGLYQEAAFFCIEASCDLVQPVTGDRGPLKQAVYGMHSTIHASTLSFPICFNGSIASDALLHRVSCVSGDGSAVGCTTLLRVFFAPLHCLHKFTLVSRLLGPALLVHQIHLCGRETIIAVFRAHHVTPLPKSRESDSFASLLGSLLSAGGPFRLMVHSMVRIAMGCCGMLCPIAICISAA